jgi:glutathione S-transferase
MPELILYNYELDENCYRVRLLLSVLGLAWKSVAIDVIPGREQEGPAMLALNPLGQLPILRDDDLVLSGTGAIMAYLARRYDETGTLLPLDPQAFGQVQKWLEFAMTALKPAYEARLSSLFGASADETSLVKAARNALRIMDDFVIRQQFSGTEWFVGDTATLADLVLFPAFALSRDYGVQHAEFDGLRRWSRRVRAMPGFKTMPGIPDYH